MATTSAAWGWFRRAKRAEWLRERTTETKFSDFLRHGFGVSPAEYRQMDKTLQAALSDKFAYVFLHEPTDELVRQFLLASPAERRQKNSVCHAPGCEWRTMGLPTFGLLARHCLRCEHYQMAAAAGGGEQRGAWRDVTRQDFEFLLQQDERHQAQWDEASAAAAPLHGTTPLSADAPTTARNTSSNEVTPSR